MHVIADKEPLSGFHKSLLALRDIKTSIYCLYALLLDVSANDQILDKLFFERAAECFILKLSGNTNVSFCSCISAVRFNMCVYMSARMLRFLCGL